MFKLRPSYFTRALAPLRFVALATRRRIQSLRAPLALLAAVSQLGFPAHATEPIRFLSATADPFDDTLIHLKVNQPLCQDVTACGGDARFPLSWQVRDASSPFIFLGVTEAQITDGTNVTLITAEPRQPNVTYDVVVDPMWLTDISGNLNLQELRVRVTHVFGFQQGFNGYSGTSDTDLREADPDSIQSGNSYVAVDADDGGGVSYGLLRFDNLFGFGTNRIPLGTEIRSATLILTHSAIGSDGDPVRLHRLLTPFDSATTTYNNFGLTPGLDVDGIEASTNVDAYVISKGRVPPFTTTIDVTASVRAWGSGEPNYGWGFVPTGRDGFRWDSSESAHPPQLLLEPGFIETAPPPYIVRSPASVTVVEGNPFTLAPAYVAIGPIFFQWFKNGVAIPGAEHPSYTQVATLGPDGSAGNYRVRVTNPSGFATSDPAVVTVTPDSVPPRLLSAAINAHGTVIRMQFSKPLEPPSALEAAHYSLSPMAVLKKVELASNNTVVTLTTEPLAIATYELGIRNLVDTRYTPNLIAPNPTVVHLSGYAVVFSYDAEWRYATNSQDETLTATPWHSARFDDSAWQGGPGFFGNENSASVVAALPAPGLQTLLGPSSDPRAVTAYFRRSFTLPTLPAGGIFAFCHYLDDGAVIYLDGVELARLNMSTISPVSFTNLAATSVEASFQSFLFSASSGTHLLAVEVHQATSNDADLIFGAAIVALPAPPELTVTGIAAGIQLEWPPEDNWELTGSAGLDLPFSPVVGTTPGNHLLRWDSILGQGLFRLRYHRTLP